jgi:hypothetical protein
LVEFKKDLIYNYAQNQTKSLILESISAPTLAPRKKGLDTTQNMAPIVHQFANQADHLTLGKVAEIQASRNMVSKSTLKLQRHAAELKESLDKFKEAQNTSATSPTDFIKAMGGSATSAKALAISAFKDEFIQKYRANISELESIWSHFKERHADILGEGDLFIPNFADHENVTTESIEKCIENCNLLRERLQTVDWPESDALLTTTLELNTILMRFLHEIGREIANQNRTKINNQRAH